MLLGFRVPLASQASCRARVPWTVSRASNNEKDEKVMTVRYNVKKGIPRISLRDRRDVFQQIAAQMEVGDSLDFQDENNAYKLSTEIRRLGHSSVTQKIPGGRRVSRLKLHLPPREPDARSD